MSFALNFLFTNYSSMIFAAPVPTHKYLQQLPQISAPIMSLQLLMGFGIAFPAARAEF